MTFKVNGLSVAILVLLSSIQSKIIKTAEYAKIWNITQTLDDKKNPPFTYFGQPDLFYDKNVGLLIHANYLECNVSRVRCRITMECINCADNKPSLTRRFVGPSIELLHEGKVDLHPLRNSDKRFRGIVIDWASRAYVPRNSVLERPIEAHNWLLTDPSSYPWSKKYSLKLTDRDNGNRKFIARHHDAVDGVKFTYIYADPDRCDNGLTKLVAYYDDSIKFHCLNSLRENAQIVDIAVGRVGKSGDEDTKFYLEKGEEDWAFYEKSSFDDDQKTKLKYKFNRNDYRGDYLFDLPRLSHFHSSEAVVCWLPDIDLASDIHCYVMGLDVNNPFTRQITLNFPYTVRDFEVDIIDSRIIALTCLGEELKCRYDLWEFDLNGKLTDGPLRVEGPSCMFSHRLSPKPIIEINNDNFCVGFAFEYFAYYERTEYKHKKVRPYSVEVKCFKVT